jgi:hypothetical protein
VNAGNIVTVNFAFEVVSKEFGDSLFRQLLLNVGKVGGVPRDDPDVAGVALVAASSVGKVFKGEVKDSRFDLQGWLVVLE